MREQAQGIDTALARVLERDGSINPALLQSCLGEIRQRRWVDPDVSLAVLLLERRLVAADRLERALSEVVHVGDTLREPRPRGLESSADRAPAAFGPYRVVRELARGGMGIVFEVEHMESGVRYALKTVIGGQLVAEELLEERERFGREAELTARLDHPHIVRVHGAHLEGNWPYLVQDLLPGGSLHERLRTGPLPLEEALEVTLALGQALKHAHARQVIHRDLKPQNVLFDDRGEARLLDFGLARSVRATSLRLTATGTIMGTPGYMAPEQARGEKEVGAEADVYSLAALLFAMLTGNAPFPGQQVFQVLDAVLHEPPPALRSQRTDLPPATGQALEHILQRGLAKDPSQRLDLDELLEALRALGRGDARGLGPHRKAAPLIAGALLLGLVLVGVGLFLLKQRHDQRTAWRTWETYRSWEAETLRPFNLGLLPGKKLSAEAVASRIEELEGARASLPGQAQVELDAALTVLRAHRRLLSKQVGVAPLTPIDQLVDALLLRETQPARALQLVNRVLDKSKVGPELLPALLLRLELLAHDRLQLLRVVRRPLPPRARPLAFRVLANHYREVAAQLPLTRQPPVLLAELAQLSKALRLQDDRRLTRVKTALLEAHATAWKESLFGAIRTSRELKQVELLGTFVRQAPRVPIGPALKQALRQVEQKILAPYQPRSTAARYLRNQRFLLRTIKVDQAIYYGIDSEWRWPDRLAEPTRVALLARGNSLPELIEVGSLACLRGGSNRSAERLVRLPTDKTLAELGRRAPRSRLFRVVTFLRSFPPPKQAASLSVHLEYADRLGGILKGPALEDLAPIYRAEMHYRVGVELGEAKKQALHQGDEARVKQLSRRVIPWMRQARSLGLYPRKLEHCGFHEANAHEHLGNLPAMQQVWLEILPKLWAWAQKSVAKLERASTEPLTLARSLYNYTHTLRRLRKPEQALKQAHEGLRVMKTMMRQPDLGVELRLRSAISQIHRDQKRWKQAYAILAPLLPRGVLEGAGFAEEAVVVTRHLKRLDEARDLLRRCQGKHPESEYLKQARQELLGSK